MYEVRTCIICRKKNNKSELIRIIGRDGLAAIDKTKKANTRGMYICNNKECIKRLEKVKSLSKLMKIKVTEESFRSLIKDLGEN